MPEELLCRLSGEPLPPNASLAPLTALLAQVTATERLEAAHERPQAALANGAGNSQEGENGPNVPLQEKCHGGILRESHERFPTPRKTTV